MSTTRHPDILWAQRSDKIFLTVELPDAKDAQVTVEPDGRFTFTATAKDAAYKTELQLYGAVKTDSASGLKIMSGGRRRNTFCVIAKAEKGWWHRLLRQEGKAPLFVRADWNHWIDEDEEDDALKRADLNMTRAMMDQDQPGEREPDSDDEEDYEDDDAAKDED